MKCKKCNAVLRENDELKWECNTCHQMCKANLTMLMQIQAQRNNGYTGTMVSCPFCGGVLDDGHETIHWDCMYCGTRQTGDIKTFLSPDVAAPPGQSEAAQKSAEEAGLVWADGGEAEEVKDPRAERRARRERERAEREREREEREKKGFFADEEEKNRFLAESSIQSLGEEIPDSLFDDIPFRGKPKASTAAASEPSAPPVAETAAPEPPVSPAGAPPTSVASVAEPPASTATNAAAPPKPAGTPPAAEPPTSTATNAAAPPKPVGTPPAAEPPASTATNAAAPPKPAGTPPAAETPASTAANAAAAPKAASANTTLPKNTTSSETAAQRRPLGPKTASGPIPPSSTAFASSASATPPTGPDSDKASENVSFEREREKEPEKKQIWPKVITAVITLLLIAAVGIGGYVAVQYFLAPTRQFRTAVQKEDLTTAEEIYTSKIKGNQDDERVAEIAVEHFLSEAFELYKKGARDSSTYMKLKDFAERVLNMNTASYELAIATIAPEDFAPSPTPEPTADATASEEPMASEEPLESTEPTATEEVATEEPEATEEPVAAPDITEEPDTEPEDGDVSVVLAQAKEYTNQKKYEEAYNYLAPYKESDTSGQVKKEMAAVKKKWKDANIKEFKALCAKLTIVYAAAEKQYHIVPRGYYTNYNQIARSNNVGGIAYMDQSKKKVSVTKIGKKGAITSYGKTNRANLMKFKEMIEKYPYLAEQI